MASIKGQTCVTNHWVCSVTSGDCPNVWLARLLKVFYLNFWLIQTKRKSNIDYPLWVLTTPIIDWLLPTCLGTLEVLGKSLAIGFWIQMSDFKPKSVVVKFFHPIDRTYIRLQDPNIANSAKVTYEIKSNFLHFYRHVNFDILGTLTITSSQTEVWTTITMNAKLVYQITFSPNTLIIITKITIIGTVRPLPVVLLQTQ